jgi:hypothetical protein
MRSDFSGCRLYSRTATSGRICPMVYPRRFCLACAGWGRRCRLSPQKATWRTRLGHSHRACAGGAVLRQGGTFSGRIRRFSGTRRASFASCVRRNLSHSQVGRSMFSRPYTYNPATALLSTPLAMRDTDATSTASRTHSPAIRRMIPHSSRPPHRRSLKILVGDPKEKKRLVAGDVHPHRETSVGM